MVKTDLKYDPDIQKLIDDLYRPGYITQRYADIGITPLIILSQVFRFDKSYLGSYLADILIHNQQLYRDKKVLDLGCGCGILGAICSKHGAGQVHFCDINPMAIKNSRINSILLDLKNVSFSCGDLFTCLPSNIKFDLIVFNPPNIPGTPQDNTQPALIREDRVILDFYKKFPCYLKKDGILILPGSSRFDGELSPLKMIKKNKLKSKMIDKREEKDGNYKYVVIIEK
jgi:tRNA1(Val) A37 N6-methylase TrmN6